MRNVHLVMVSKIPSWRRVVAYVVVFLGGLWTVLPLYWLFITAFKPWLEVVQVGSPTFIPQTWTLSGFAQAWSQGGKGILDSTIIVVGTLLVSLTLGIPAAYSFSRFGTGGRNLPFLLLAFRLMPPVALTSAVYLIAASLSLVDTHLLLILINSVVSTPFVIWIMKGFIDEIPYAIEEAAQMDGASWLRAVLDHVLPLTKPGLVSVMLLVAIFTWNELLFAMILTGPDVIPFTRVVPGLQIGRKYLLLPNWPAVAALGVLDVAAILLIGSYLQRHIVRAMSYGAIKEAVWE